MYIGNAVSLLTSDIGMGLDVQFVVSESTADENYLDIVTTCIHRIDYVPCAKL